MFKIGDHIICIKEDTNTAFSIYKGDKIYIRFMNKEDDYVSETGAIFFHQSLFELDNNWYRKHKLKKLNRKKFI